MAEVSRGMMCDSRGIPLSNTEGCWEWFEREFGFESFVLAHNREGLEAFHHP